jgi:uncharacterized protein (TIGR03083 family)
MSLSQIHKDRTVDALASTWSSIRELLGSLTPDQWRLPTVLPGWDVQANVSHIIGTEAMFLDEPAPAVELDESVTGHVRNEIGKFNEIWVQGLDSWTPEQVLATFDDFTARRLEALRAMTQADWDAESMTPAGKATYGRFVQIRVFDCWFHEQDIREAVGRPGHLAGPAVAVTLDEVSTALGFVVGKKAKAPEGSTVSFELTGSSGRVINVAVGERAQVVESLDGPATVQISMPAVAFTRLCGGRAAVSDYADQITMMGDAALGQQILAALAYTI